MNGIQIKPFHFIMLFAAAAALIKLDSLLAFAGKLIGLLFPVAFGLILAALLNSPAEKAEKATGRIFKNSSQRFRRCAGVFSIYIAAAAAIAVIISVLVPRLSESARLFVNSFDGYYENFMRHMDMLKSSGGFSVIAGGVDFLLEFMRGELPKIAEKAYSMTSAAVYSVTGFLVAAVISIYLLIDKDRFLVAASRVLTYFLGEEKMCRTVRFAGLIAGCFSRFISGQLTEALVLGIMCFLGMIIFGFDYPLLISVIIGITALIPVIGALIGTVPSALMLFLIEPAKALWFIVFILVLQQLENNLIYPRIVGKSVGLPPALILIAIMIGAGIGGAAGILIGIPAASAVYLIIKEKTDTAFQGTENYTRIGQSSNL